MSLPFITDRLSQVKRKVLVLSGKGGVGKSTVTAQLAWTMAADVEKQVGVLDIDVCGPSMPRMMGVHGESLHQSNLGWTPVYAEDNLAVMSIAFLLPDPDAAVIWRGPKKNGMIKQFLRDVEWGPLDLLLVDTPPGTSDEHLSIVQYLKESSIDGAVLVTTPQEVSLQDVRKEINFCRKVDVKILGVIENMSGFVCPHCQGCSELFPVQTGGAKKMCADMNVPYLGAIPMDPRLGSACDKGYSFVKEIPDSPASLAYQSIISELWKSIQ